MSWFIEVPRAFEEGTPFFLMVSNVIHMLENGGAVSDQGTAATTELIRRNGIQDTSETRKAFLMGFFSGLSTADPRVDLYDAAMIAGATMFWCSRDVVSDDDLPEIGPS